MDALAAIGPGLDRVVFAVCIRETGMGDVERAEGWPKRSGKVALKLGLTHVTFMQVRLSDTRKKALEQFNAEVRAIPAPTGGSRKFADRMNAFAQAQGLPGMGYIFWRKAEDGSTEAAGPIAKALGPEKTEAIRTQLGLAEGDAGILDGVVVVHMQVALGAHGHVDQ